MAVERTLLVGLGNPGPSYATHRHNLGAMVIDVLAARHGERLRAHRAGADVAETRIAGHRVVLARPRSYMNLSGGPVAALARFFHLEPGSVAVVHDDLDLPFRAIRLKQGGGEGGHNGLRSISSALGSRDYVRLRFGIGRPSGRTSPADFVLQNFSVAERRELPVSLEEAADAAEMLIADGITAAQNRLH